MRFFSTVLLLILTVAFSVFLGCNGGSNVKTAIQLEKMQQTVCFLHDHVAGLEIARQERKPTLIFFSVPDNVGSQRMMETTFRDDEIKQLTEWLIFIHVDGSQETALCESLGISSFPTIILSSANGVEVRRLVGGQTPDQLAVQIHILLQVMALRPQTVSGR